MPSGTCYISPRAEPVGDGPCVQYRSGRRFYRGSSAAPDAGSGWPDPALAMTWAVASCGRPWRRRRGGRRCRRSASAPFSSTKPFAGRSDEAAEPAGCPPGLVPSRKHGVKPGRDNGAEAKCEPPRCPRATAARCRQQTSARGGQMRAADGSGARAKAASGQNPITSPRSPNASRRWSGTRDEAASRRNPITSPRSPNASRRSPIHRRSMAA